MATDDRKQRILEHLKRSTDEGMLFISPKTSTQPSQSSSQPTPPPKPVSQPKAIATPLSRDERKRRIMTHVKSSSGEFGDFSLSSEERKKKIEDHIRKSIS